MNREVIRPNFETPVIVRLDKGPEGIQREGQYGIDFQYTVNNDTGVMWLPAEARQQLMKLGVQSGDEVAIKKVKRGRSTLWEVERVEDEPAPATAAAKQAANAASNAAPEEVFPLAEQMLPFLRGALRAAILTEREASELGKKLVFSAGDIHALACTLYINARKASEAKGGR